MNTTLAEEIKRRVLAEPRSVTMHFFCEFFSKDSAKGKKLDWCGTAGCIAGHAILASGIQYKSLKALDINTEPVARELLRLSKREANALFYFYDHTDVDKAEQYPYVHLAVQLKKQRPGTQRYAKIVANAIDLCIERHRTGVYFREEREL